MHNNELALKQTPSIDAFTLKKKCIHYFSWCPKNIYEFYLCFLALLILGSRLHSPSNFLRIRILKYPCKLIFGCDKDFLNIMNNSIKISPAHKTGFFFGPFEKNSRKRKLKPQENNSKLKQKTQGFGKVWKIKYKYWPKQRGKYRVMAAIWLECLIFNWNTAKIVYFSGEIGCFSNNTR